jgi:hypothetical protein
MISSRILNASLRYVAPAVAVGIGLAVFNPGAMSPDSFSILEQARTLALSEAHPPLLAILWHFTEKVWLGPLPILFLNLAFFYFANALIFAETCRRFSLASIPMFFVLALWPPVFGIIGVIWVDISMAAFFCASVGLFLLHERISDSFRRRIVLIASLLCLFLAIGFRHNAVVAAVPLAIFFAWRLMPAKRRRSGVLVAAALGTGACAAMFGLHHVITRAVIVGHVPLSQFIAIYDLAGISKIEGSFLFDKTLFPHNSQRDVETLYTPRSIIPLQMGEQIHAPAPYAKATPFSNFGNPESIARLWENWRHVVRTHFGAYLLHRWLVFREILGLSDWYLWGPVYNVIDDNAFGVPARQTYGSFLYRYALLSDRTSMFRPYLYFAAGLALMSALTILRTRNSLLAAGLVFSGLLYSAALFFVAMSPDYRYSHWLVTSTTLALAVLMRDGIDAMVEKRYPPLLSPQCDNGAASAETDP